ncbi:hypothetical protein BDP81DRAFT_32297 [Colletotrichum phormii]|uniref:Uncharacterized protein n=1 Tax=Colletotrichum phormii TaxID=359342 RepID=A0AAI9ZS40_9PEZI|nr:uncharacterized protein BDP81DRAFT_32297 [Colletotrichum phormii]KAK1636003.1 hypothetical protein BDP81DRAFT_32297 [Colletotrichum phormii]
MHTNTFRGTAPCLRGVCLLAIDWSNEANHSSSIMVVLFDLLSPSPRLPRIKDGTTGPRRDEFLQLSWIAILRDGFAVQERGWTCWKPWWFCGRAAMSGPVLTKAGVRPSAGCARKNVFLHVASGTAAKRSPGKERNLFCPPPPPFPGSSFVVAWECRNRQRSERFAKGAAATTTTTPSPICRMGIRRGEAKHSESFGNSFQPPMLLISVRNHVSTRAVDCETTTNGRNDMLRAFQKPLLVREPSLRLCEDNQHSNLDEKLECTLLEKLSHLISTCGQGGVESISCLVHSQH